MYEGVTHSDIKALVAKFPHASRKFLEINGLEPQISATFPVPKGNYATAPIPLVAKLPHPQPKPKARRSLGPVPQGLPRSEGSIAGRTICTITLFKCRLFDRDNAFASCKALIDALRYAGILEDDTEKSVALMVDQVRVMHRHLEGTGVSIEYPILTK